MSDETSDTKDMNFIEGLERQVDTKVEDVVAKGDIRTQIVNEMAEEKIQLRKNATSKALGERNRLIKQIQKLRNPDVKTFEAGEDGKPVKKMTFSEARVDELNKAENQLKEVENMLQDALSESPNFDKILKKYG